MQGDRKVTGEHTGYKDVTSSAIHLLYYVGTLLPQIVSLAVPWDYVSHGIVSSTSYCQRMYDVYYVYLGS